MTAPLAPSTPSSRPAANAPSPAGRRPRRERAEADGHEARARLHERGLADDELDTERERLGTADRDGYADDRGERFPAERDTPVPPEERRCPEPPPGAAAMHRPPVHRRPTDRLPVSVAAPPGRTQ